MSAYRNITFRCKDGDPQSVEILLDGEPLRGVVRFEVIADGRENELLTVRLELYANELVVEADLDETRMREYTLLRDEAA